MPSTHPSSPAPTPLRQCTTSPSSSPRSRFWRFGEGVVVAIDHPAYSEEVLLSPATVAELAADLGPHLTPDPETTVGVREATV